MKTQQRIGLAILLFIIAISVINFLPVPSPLNYIFSAFTGFGVGLLIFN